MGYIIYKLNKPFLMIFLKVEFYDDKKTCMKLQNLAEIDKTAWC